MNNSVSIVTGGAGFIGSHLTRELVNRGHRVIVIDNLITTKRLMYIDDLITKENSPVLFLNADVCDIDKILSYLELFPIENIDYIFHLASPASVKLYSDNPLLTLHSNTIGLENMLKLATTSGAKLLYTSTSEIYGDPDVHPQSEFYTGNVYPMCTRSCYDESKRLGETLCYLYYDLYKVNVHVARLFNVYGPNNTDDRVMPTLISQCMNNKPMTIHGDGLQTRSFCYVDDIVDGLIRLINSDYHKPVNLGNPEEITINDLAKNIAAVLNKSYNVIHTDSLEADPKRRCPDITVAKKELDWEPKVRLMEGISKVIDWTYGQ